MKTVKPMYVVFFKSNKGKLPVHCVDLQTSYKLLAHTLERENPLPYQSIRCHIYHGDKRGKCQWHFRPGNL